MLYAPQHLVFQEMVGGQHTRSKYCRPIAKPYNFQFLHDVELFFEVMIEGRLPRAIKCSGQLPSAIVLLDIVFIKKADFNIGIVFSGHIVPSFLLVGGRAHLLCPTLFWLTFRAEAMEEYGHPALFCFFAGKMRACDIPVFVCAF